MSFVIIKLAASSAMTADAAVSEAADPARIEAEAEARIVQEVSRRGAKAEAEGRARAEAEAARSAQAAAAAQAAHEAAIALAVSAFDAAWQQLIAPLAHKEETIAELVTELAFVLARHIVGLEIALHPDSVKPLVDDLVAEANRTRSAQQSIVIRLHPEDHALLAPFAVIEHVHLLADRQITRGGTIVELIAPGGDPIDKVEWDATIENRLATVRAALGLDQETGHGRQAA